MKPLPPSVAKRLSVAAGLRAAGATWEAIGRAVGCHADTCRKWPTRYAAEWIPLLRSAKQSIQEDAEAEARTTLRTLLRSENDNLRRDAAKLILANAPPVPAARANDDTGRMEQFLSELDDAEKQLLDAAIDEADSLVEGDSPGQA